MKSATRSHVPSSAPLPGSFMGSGKRNESLLQQSHTRAIDLLRRLGSSIAVHGNDPALNKKLLADYLPEIQAALSMAKWAGGER